MTNNSIDALRQKLRAPDWQTRKGAVRELDYMTHNPDAIPPLIDALDDAHFTVRHLAAQALGHAQDTRATTGLTKALRDDSMMVRAAAAMSLGQIRNPDAVPALIGALRDPDFHVRDHAAKGLANIGEPSVLALCKAAHDRNEFVHRHACEALSTIGDLTAVDDLLDIAEHEEVNRRINAIRALGKLKAMDALQTCINALDSDDPQEMIDAAYALAAIGDPVAIASLVKRIDEVKVIGRVAEFGDDALPDLIAMLHDSPTLDHLIGTINALERVRNPDAVPYLVPFLRHEEVGIRLATVNALGWIADARPVWDLIPMLHDTSPVGKGRRLCDYVARALNNIGTSDAFDALDRWYGAGGDLDRYAHHDLE